MRIRSTARFGILLLLMGLLLAACQPLIVPERNSVTPAINDGGRLAYIGGDGNVYVISADLTQKVAITDDATTASEGSGRSYHRVAWAPDGGLAFANPMSGKKSQLVCFGRLLPDLTVRLTSFLAGSGICTFTEMVISSRARLSRANSSFGTTSGFSSG